jgi:hypothetical protein
VPAQSRPLPREVVLPGYGKMLATSIPDDAPDAVREGMVRRRLVAMGRTCPCGARVVGPNRATRRANRGVSLQRVLCVHDDACPASDENMRAALDAWPTA